VKSTRLTTPIGKAYFDLTKAIGIIEDADRRACAWDGDVGHVRDEMTDKEWRDLYRALVRAHKSLGQVAA
jgi:hypothetical protein